MPSATRTQQQYVQYHERVLATNPIAYWPLNEKVGTVAYDWVTARNLGAQNGVHAGVTLWQNGIGDGRVCPLYNGANGYTNVQTATFVTNFDGREGSIMFWARVSSAGVWTDGTRRDAYYSIVDAGNYIILRRSAANGQLDWLYRAGATTESVALGGQSTIEWFQMGLTWSLSAGVDGEVKAYFNGAQTGATQTSLGAWVGAIVSATIGATNTTPANPWSGTLAHFAVWNRPISADEIQQLYRARWS